ECADSAAALILVQVPLPLEPLVAVRQPRRPHPDEVAGHRVLGAFRAVRVDGDGAGGLVDDVGSGAALQPGEIEIGFVVDAPQLVGGEVTGEVVNQGLGGVHVRDGREGAAGVGGVLR